MIVSLPNVIVVNQTSRDINKHVTSCVYHDFVSAAFVCIACVCVRVCIDVCTCVCARVRVCRCECMKSNVRLLLPLTSHTHTRCVKH